MRKMYLLVIIFVLVIGTTGYILTTNKDTTNMKNVNRTASDGNIESESKESDSEDVIEEIEVGVNIWNKAPNFTLTDIDGNNIQLTDFQGKKILLNFWTSWCRYCKAEMTELIEFYRVKDDSELVVLSVNVSSEERKTEDAYQFIKENNLPFPVVFDKDGVITELYRVQGYPTNIFIDQSGVIRQKILGGITIKDVQTIFDEMQ